ncbi:MAG: class B sortase [Lachnospiraceae bacterium]|nr:class B sortase [Lachnospiraceae bacterium]
MDQKKLIGMLNKALDLCLMTGFLAVFLLGLYFTCDLVHVHAGVRTEKVMKYRPADGQTAGLKELSEDCVGWLTIDGTGIDYPVMQGRDNVEYLNKDPYGEYSLAGSVFLDSRNAPDFSDPYLLIYGHHMEAGAMFGALDAFSDPRYFASHRSGRLTTADGVFRIRLFAFLETDVKDRAVFSPTEGEGPRGSISERAAIDYGAPRDAVILGLSTCTKPLSSKRICLFGVLEKEDRTEEMS